ncbi:MAG: DUF2064 domain-containing protein [Actinomycetota bacterium]|nr:DUF2064 domain-containing protein [Actinomycetota bacterium]
MIPGLQLLVLAKAPVPGRVKTRLCPPYLPHEAAGLDGDSDLVDSRGLEVLAQGAGALDVRLAAAFAAVAGAPAFLVGMDTPQLTSRHLTDAGDALFYYDACLGPTVDGGWWGLGLRHPDPDLLLGVRCSLPTTGQT